MRAGGCIRRPKRAEILFKVAELLRDRKPELTRTMTEEMGKVLAEAGGDVQEGIDMTYYMAGEGRRMFGQTVPAEMPDKFAMSLRQPMGVVAVITPFNFPMAIPTWKLMPALVTGNTAVFKPAGDTPLLGEMLVEIFEEAGLPKGVINIVHGGGATVGERLIEHPDVKIVTFTGSKETGIHVAAHGADTLKRIHLELGGKNAIIVMDDADLDNAVDGILWSAFGTSGQRCTAASRVIVHERVYDGLASKLVARAEQLRIGNGLDPAVDVGPLINQAALDKVDRYTGIARDEGAEILTGGEHYRNGEQRVLLPADDLWQGRSRHARRDRRDLRAGDGADPLQRPRRCDRYLKPGGVRPFERDLHRRRECGVPRDPRPRHRHHLHQRRHDRRRDPAAVRRHQVHRKRPPRGRDGRARHLHRVEVGVRGLLRQAAARPDRQPAVMRLTELHADLQTLRENLAAELAAINRYEAQAFSLADERAQEVVQRIADDKKEHVARLLDLLRRLDVKQREKIERLPPA